jgi:hypothetical protein
MRLLLKADSSNSISYVRTRHGMMHPVIKYPERFIKSIYRTIKDDVLRLDMIKISLLGMLKGNILGCLGFFIYFLLVFSVFDDIRRDHWRIGSHSRVEMFYLVAYIIMGTFFSKKE